MAYVLKKCFKCKKVITGQSRDLGKQLFHFDCLTCNHCKGVLGGDDNGKIRDNRIFCKACFTKRFRPRCDACRQPIAEGDGLKTQGKTLHQACFRCSGCQRPMGPGKQVLIKGDVYCQVKCQQDRVARENAAAAALKAAAQAAKNAPAAPASTKQAPRRPKKLSPSRSLPLQNAPPTREPPQPHARKPQPHARKPQPPKAPRQLEVIQGDR